MDRIRTQETIDRQRGVLLGAGAATLAAARFGLMRQAVTESSTTPHSTFGPLKQAKPGPLNIGYADMGAPDSPAVILPHGDGRTTFTVMLTSPHCWYPPAIVLLFHICVVMGQCASSPPARRATASSRWSRSMRST
jgi:hypothetical protein